MAGVDYTGILNTVEEILRTDPLLQDVKVEAANDLNLDAGGWVGIFLVSRSPQSDEQPIAAGRKAVYYLEFEIWCWQSSNESPRRAEELRNALLSTVEAVLLKYPTLRDTVQGRALRGGTLGTVVDQAKGFVSGGQVLMTARVSLTASE